MSRCPVDYAEIENDRIMNGKPRMSRCPVDYAEIENDRIMNGKPRMNRADGFELEPPELVRKVKLEQLDKFVESLMNNHDYYIDGKSFALHECMAEIDYDHEMWDFRAFWQYKTLGDTFSDDPLKAAQMVADKLLPMDFMMVIIARVIRVGKLALDIE